ncbi:MAG TPA: Holliday junction DNA helicase RuvB C-terminal domain-containing protein [Candidatus Methanoperedens sp.]
MHQPQLLSLHCKPRFIVWLDELDRKILSIISKDFGGGPVGVKTIAISAGER